MEVASAPLSATVRKDRGPGGNTPGPSLLLIVRGSLSSDSFLSRRFEDAFRPTNGRPKVARKTVESLLVVLLLSEDGLRAGCLILLHHARLGVCHGLSPVADQH